MKDKGRKGGANELTIKSHQAMKTRIKMPLQVVLRTYQKATKEASWGRQTKVSSRGVYI